MPSQLSGKQNVAAIHAVSALCGADYELACAVTILERAGHPAAAEAEALFQTALAFRQKMETEVDA